MLYVIQHIKRLLFFHKGNLKPEIFQECFKKKKIFKYSKATNSKRNSTSFFKFYKYYNIQ